MKVVRSRSAVHTLLDDCVAAEQVGETGYPNLTYEQGVLAAIRWVFDTNAGHPLDD